MNASAFQESGIILARLAVARTLANPPGDLAVVSDRDPNHTDEALGGVATGFDNDMIEWISLIMVGAVPVSGSSPESVKVVA